MTAQARSNEWLCINCGHVLGSVLGGELHPAIDGQYLRTSGPNLNCKCPQCGQTKVFYTSDPVVRAVYQLVNAISSVAAEAMIKEVGRAIHTQTNAINRESK